MITAHPVKRRLELVESKRVRYREGERSRAAQRLPNYIHPTPDTVAGVTDSQAVECQYLAKNKNERRSRSRVKEVGMIITNGNVPPAG